MMAASERINKNAWAHRLWAFLLDAMKEYHLTEKQLQTLRDLIRDGKEDRFYSWRIWRDHVQPAVLALDKEPGCKKCRARGRYSRPVIAHHVKPLRSAPELAVSIYDPDTGERQIIGLCKRCHEEEHPESLQSFKRSEPLTVERWD